jgi:hypothetical protein
MRVEEEAAMPNKSPLFFWEMSDKPEIPPTLVRPLDGEEMDPPSPADFKEFIVWRFLDLLTQGYAHRAEAAVLFDNLAAPGKLMVDALATMIYDANYVTDQQRVVIDAAIDAEYGE